MVNFIELPHIITSSWRQLVRHYIWLLVLAATFVYYAFVTFYQRRRGTNEIARVWTDAFSIHTNVIKITIPKMTDTSKGDLLLGAGIRHLTAASQYHVHSKQVPACVSNNCLNLLIIGNILSACAVAAMLRLSGWYYLPTDAIFWGIIPVVT